MPLSPNWSPNLNHPAPPFPRASEAQTIPRCHNCIERRHTHKKTANSRDFPTFVTIIPESNVLLSCHSKIEDAFYNNKLRFNGQKLIKKSKTVSAACLRQCTNEVIQCSSYFVLFSGKTRGHPGPGPVREPRNKHCYIDESYPQKGFY